MSSTVQCISNCKYVSWTVACGTKVHGGALSFRCRISIAIYHKFLHELKQKSEIIRHSYGTHTHTLCLPDCVACRVVPVSLRSYAVMRCARTDNRIGAIVRSHICIHIHAFHFIIACIAKILSEFHSIIMVYGFAQATYHIFEDLVAHFVA